MVDLILPGHPEFNLSLAAIPPDFSEIRHQFSGECAMVCRSGSDIPEAIGGKDLDEYICGGEWDERIFQLNLLDQLEAAAWVNSGFLSEEDEEDFLPEWL